MENLEFNSCPTIPSFIGFKIACPAIPSVLDNKVDWNSPLQVPSFTLLPIPSCITINHDLPPKITIQVPDIKVPIFITNDPPPTSCNCIIIRSPGDIYQQYLDAKENVGIHITTDEKCHAILEDVANKIGLSEGESFDDFVNNLYKCKKIS